MSAEYPLDLNKQVINDYRAKHNIDASISDSGIISIIISDGNEHLLKAKFDKIEKDLLFGFGFAEDSIDNLQISHKYLSYENSTIDTQRDKKLTRSEEKALMEFTQSYLMDSINSAIEIHNNYVADMGPLSYLWQGIKNLANHFDISKDNRDITTVNERANDLNTEYNDTKLIADSSTSGSFESRFERIRGVKYDAYQVKKFAQQSEKYMVVLAHKEKYDKLNQGIAELKEIYHTEQQLEKLRAMGQNIPAEANPDVSFDEKFIQIIDEYCEGDEGLKAYYIKFVSEGIESKDELEEKEKFLNALNKLESLTKALYKNELDGKTFEYYEKAYENGYSKTFGGANPKEESQAWVIKQKQGEGFVKMGLIIATTVATGGSSFVATMGQNLAKEVGVAAAGQIIKAGMTLEGVFVGTAIDYANALGSESGLTKEKNKEILQNTAYMLPFAFFGAYISGPTGQSIVNGLQGKISANLSNIVRELCDDAANVAGFTTEIALDTLFESVLFDGDIMAVIKGNATGEAQARALNALAMMITGGRANAAAANITQKIGMEDFKVSIDVGETGDVKLALVAPDGKMYPVDGAEEIIAGVMAKYAEAEAGALKNTANMPDVDIVNLRLADNQDYTMHPPFVSAQAKSQTEAGIDASRLIEANENYKDNVQKILDLHFNNIAYVQDLPLQHRLSLKRELLRNEMDFNSFMAVMLDAKPAFYDTFNIENIDAIKGLQNEKFDVITRRINMPPFVKDHYFVLNKELVKNIILENREFFAFRLGLEKNASVDEIYANIISEEGIFAKNAGISELGLNDITGLVLGYPKIGSMIFELENRIPDFDHDLRYHIDLTEWKNSVLNVLYSQNSPYKDLGDDFVNKLADEIASITSIRISTKIYDQTVNPYCFVDFGTDAGELTKIQQNIDKYTIKMDKAVNDDINRIKNELLNEKVVIDGKIYPKYSTQELEYLTDAAEKDPKLFENLYKDTTLEPNGDVIPRFNNKEIVELIDMAEDNPGLFNNVINQKMPIKTKNGTVNTPRFSFNSIKKFMSLVKTTEDVNLFNELLDAKKMIYDDERPRFHEDEIVEMMSCKERHTPIFKELLNAVKGYAFKEEPRFYGNEIVSLVEIAKLNPDFFEKLLNEKNEKSTNRKYISYRFSSNEICDLMYLEKTLPENKKDLFYSLFEYEDLQFGKIHKRFSGSDISKLMNVEKENPVLFKQLVDRHIPNTDPKCYNFNTDTIIQLMRVSKKNPELFNILLNAKENDHLHLFSAYEIEKIMALQIDIELVEYIINQKVVKNNKFL